MRQTLKKKELENIQVILFDIDNTLLDFKKCAEASIKAAFRKWGIEYTDNVIDVFLEINNKYWDLYEEDKITRDYLYQHRFQEVFDRLGIDIPGAEFEKDFIKVLFSSCEKIDNVDEVVKYLANKYDLYIASNSSYDEQSTRLKGADLFQYFKEVYTSEDLGSRIMEDIDHGINKENVLIIGDSINADILGGKKFGIKTCWYNKFNKEDNEVSDITIDSLDELVEVL